MHRKFWYSILGILALGVVSFAPISRYVFRQQVLSYLKQSFGGSVSYSSSTFDSGSLVLKDVHVEGRGVLALLKARQLRVESQGWLRPKGPLQVDIQQPLLSLDLQRNSFGHRHESYRNSLPRLASITLHEGTVRWWEGSRLHAQGEWSGTCQLGHESSQGSLSLAIREDEQDSFLTLHWVGNELASCDLEISDFPARFLGGLCQLIGPNHLCAALKEGRVDGQWHWNSSARAGDSSHGQILVKKLLLQPPASAFQLRAPELKIALESAGPATGSAAAFRLTGEAQLNLGDKGTPDTSWQIKGLRASVLAQNTRRVGLSCRGQWWHKGEAKALRLDAEGDDWKLTHGQVALLAAEEAPATLSWQCLKEQEVVLEWTQLAAAELNLLSAWQGGGDACESCWFNSGTSSGVLDCSPQQLHLTARVDEELTAVSPKIGMASYMQDAHVDWKFSRHLPSEQWVSQRGTFSVDEAVLSIYTHENRLPVSTAIQAVLEQKDGNGQWVAQAHGYFPEDRGAWNIDVHENVRLKLNTSARHYAAFLPEEHRKAFSNIFAEDSLELQGSIDLQQETMRFVGQAEITPADGSEVEHIQLRVEKTNVPGIHEADGLPSWWNSANSLAKMFMEEDQRPFSSTLFPTARILFCSENLPLKRYLEGFTPPYLQLEIEGYSCIDGCLEDGEVTVQFDGRDIQLTSPVLRLTIPSLTTETSGHPSHPGILSYHIEREELQVRIPIPEATLQETTHGLAVEQLFGVVTIDENCLAVEGLEGVVEGLYCKGSLRTLGDWCQGIGANWQLAITAMHGQLSDMRRMMSRFDKSRGLVHCLPMEGSMALDDMGGAIRVEIHADHTLATTASFHGQMSNGTLLLPSSDVNIQEIQAAFNYEYPRNVLAFHDIQGTILIGNPFRYVEEYTLSGDRFNILQYPDQHIEFDLWVGDKNRDLIRLAGQTKNSQNCPDRVEVVFDTNSTHIGSLQPQQMELTLLDWTNAERFFLESDFDLDRLCKDLGHWSRTGLLYKARPLVDWLQSLKHADGWCHASCSYRGRNDLFCYHLSGADLQINEQRYQRFQFSGHVQKGTWVIDQLKLDELSLSADLYLREDLWAINFLGVRVGEALLAGMEGSFDPVHKLLQGKVNLFEVSLDQLQHWSFAEQWAKQYQPRGKLRGQGRIKATTLPASQSFQTYIDLTVDGQGVGAKNLRLHPLQRVACHYSSDRGLETEEFTTFLEHTRGREPPMHLQVKRCAFTPTHDTWSVEVTKFSIPDGCGRWMVSALQPLLPEAPYQMAQAVSERVTTEASVEGAFKAEVSPKGTYVQLELQPTAFTIQGRFCQTGGLRAFYTPDELTVDTQWMCQGQRVWVLFNTSCPIPPYGQLVLTDTLADMSRKAKTSGILIDWSFRKDRGFLVERAHGKLLGLQLDLQNVALSEGRREQTLEGQVQVDLTAITPFLSPKIAEKIIQWDVSGLCALQGTWKLSDVKRQWLSYYGGVTMDRLNLADYILEDVHATALLQPCQFAVESFSIHDPALRLIVPSALMQKDQNENWHVTVAEMQIERLRPLEVRRVAHRPHQSGRELTLSKCTLKNIQGVLGEENSFSANGRLHFTYSTRKAAQNSLLGYTTDFFSHLGLDMGLITPASGTVGFRIADGVLVLSELKDVYSRGKITRFILSKTAPPSLIQNDGSLDVHIRVKPNQPLLKLGDKISLHIGGNIRHPEYTVD